jgi:fucose permease
MRALSISSSTDPGSGGSKPLGANDNGGAAVAAADGPGWSFLAGCFAVVAAFGAATGVYGPALPRFERAFAVGPGAAGAVLSMHFAGALAGIVVWAALDGRVSTRAMLAAAGALVAAGGALFAVAGSWAIALIGAAVLGAGSGGLDAGVNTVLAASGRRAAVYLNLVHACFGAGAIAGPLMLAGFDGFRAPLAISAVMACGAIPLLARPPRPSRRPLSRIAGVRKRPPGGAGALALFCALFLLYVGLETGAAGWATTHLTSTGLSEDAGAAWTAVFWATFTAGRFAAAPLAARMPPARLVQGALGGAALALALVSVDAAAPAGYALLGLAIAPIFPTGIAWLSAVVRELRNATALVVAASTVGGVAFPLAMGVVIDASGDGAVPVVLWGGLAGCILAALAIGRFPAAEPAVHAEPGYDRLG